MRSTTRSKARDLPILPGDSAIPSLAAKLEWVAAAYYPSQGRAWPALFGRFPPHVDVLHKHGGHFDTRGRCMWFRKWEHVEAALLDVLALPADGLSK